MQKCVFSVAFILSLRFLNIYLFLASCFSHMAEAKRAEICRAITFKNQLGVT